MSKSHIDYWKRVLKKQKAPRAEWETTFRNRNWEIYLQFRGRREWFNLQSPNKDAAAERARHIYFSLESSGWETTLAKFKPSVLRLTRAPKLGEYLKAVEAHTTLRPKTFQTYAKKLRSLVSAIKGVSGQFSKHDCKKGGNAAWKQMVEAYRIDEITVARVQAWKRQVLSHADQSPVGQKNARHTINSVLRNAKALFSPKVLKNLPMVIASPIPLEGVDFEPYGSCRYQSSFDAVSVIQKANSQLRESRPEAYKILLLAAAAGLRRREIDALLWTQIDFERRIIRIITTEFAATKSSDSEGAVDLHPAVCAELKDLHATGKRQVPDFVICSNRPQKNVTNFEYYRCDEEFHFLVDWLRSNGVTSDKPIHALRKEFGSQIAHSHGIFNASVALRHASIEVTRSHYLDKKAPVFLDPGLALERKMA